MRGSGWELSKNRNRTGQVLGSREQKILEEIEKSRSAQRGWRSLAGFPQRASTSVPRQQGMPSTKILFLLVSFAANSAGQLVTTPSLPASHSCLSSLQLCLCRTPLSCERGQNQKAASSCPGQPVPAGMVLMEVRRKWLGAVQHLPSLPFSGNRVKYPCSLQCRKYDQEIKDKVLSCNILGWLGQSKV